MGSHFSLEFKDDNRLIEYLSVSYGMTELHGICRALNLNKEDVFNKNWLKRENCESFVDTIRQREMYGELFRTLQTQQFHRNRFQQAFSEFTVRVVDVRERNEITAKAYHVQNHPTGVTLSDWLKVSKEKTVLILGKDNPDSFMHQLKEVQSVVLEMGYEPILIKEQPEIATLTNEEKMLAYAAISRFVVIEKSDPSGQIDEAKICAFNRIPAIWLRREGMGDTWMQGDYEVDFKFIQVFDYNDDNRREVLQSAVAWIEQFLKNKKEYLDQSYPWR